MRIGSATDQWTARGGAGLPEQTARRLFRRIRTVEFLDAVGHLWATGVAINWSVVSRRAPQATSLADLSVWRRRFWVEPSSRHLWPVRGAVPQEAEYHRLVYEPSGDDREYSTIQPFGTAHGWYLSRAGRGPESSNNWNRMGDRWSGIGGSDTNDPRGKYSTTRSS